MSLVFNMVGGGSGGGSLSDTNAILTVTVPTGSDVTATKGGVTLTPTIWVQAVDNTLDCAVFLFEPSQFDSQNAWTIAATRGSGASQESTSATVTISSNEQYNLELSYNLFIVRNGIVNTAIYTGNIIKPSAITDVGEVTVDGIDYYRIYNNIATSGSTKTNCYFTPKTDFPLTGYTKLVIWAKTRGYDDRPFGVISSYGSTSTDPTYVAVQNMKTTNTTVLSDLTKFELSLDGVTGSYWVGFSTKEVSSGGQRVGEILCRDFYFAP